MTEFVVSGKNYVGDGAYADWTITVKADFVVVKKGRLYMYMSDETGEHDNIVAVFNRAEWNTVLEVQR